MGKTTAFFILSQLLVNSYWLWFTVPGIRVFPFVPFMALFMGIGTVGYILWILYWLFNNWDKRLG